MSKRCQIIFYQVESPQAKLHRLIATATEHFERKESLLIVTDGEKATQYIDELLWRAPIESFLPHGTENERILISHRPGVPFGGHALFNLTSTPLLKTNYSLKTIYELEDLSSPEKAKTFQPRYRAYSEAGHPIVSL